MNLNNRRIIVNNDFDGILSAEVLIKLYNCKVVGFSNSKDKIWFINNENFKGDELFVDMYAICYDSIDQHVSPRLNKNNLSPNSLRKRFTFDCYNKKYPFSTFLFILFYAKKDGKNISKFVPTLSLGTDVFTKKDIILRADDSLLNYLKYNENCKEWENYLCEYSNNDKDITRFFSFVKKQSLNEVETWKNNVNMFFCKKYGFSGEEIPDINTEMAKKFLKRFNIEFNDVTNVINLIHRRCTITSLKEFDKFCEEHKKNLFSFAFVYSPYTTDKKNFSYSLF